MKTRTARPCRDDDVIDARAPQFAQTILGALAVAALVLDWWLLIPILAGQSILVASLGRCFCLPCILYFVAVQPLLGEGSVEDYRPHRFAAAIGAVVLTAASIAHAAGWEYLGWSLGMLYAALALLGGLTGFCAGCQTYRLAARLRQLRRRSLHRVDVADLGEEPTSGLAVVFTHPLCTACHRLEARLREEGRRLITIDVSERPDVARKYGIAEVPVAVVVDETGRVTARLAR